MCTSGFSDGNEKCQNFRFRFNCLLTPVYRLLVSARDSGPEAVSADAAVIVRVGDVNDNPPRISVNTLLASDTDVATVPEDARPEMETDARPETFVAHVTVSDPDSGDNGRVNCSLDAPLTGNYFRFCETTSG